MAGDAGMASAPIGTATGVATRWLYWVVRGGISATKAAKAAQTAAVVAATTATTAAATANSASATAAMASATAFAAAQGVTAATSTAAAYTGLALAGGVAAMRTALVGGQVVITAPGLCCRGARFAAENIEVPTANMVYASEDDEGKPYEDIVLWPDTTDRVLYVGQFKGKTPHGSGRIFWKDTQFEAFVGSFLNGKAVEGVFISKRQVVIGHLRIHENGDGRVELEVSGFQPEAMYDPNEPCVICLENPTMLTEGRVMAPCHHGCVCVACLNGLSECPLCRTTITGDARV
jgi:hypothetical protein